MSKKSVASIKTLARYEPDTVYIGTGEYVAECVRADDGDYYLAADADAAIEALQAEIEGLREQLRLATVDQATAESEANDARAEVEALRAEVAEWKRVAAAQAELQGEAEERAERLAEALRRWWEAHRPVSWTEDQHRSCPHVNLATDAEKALATALLRDQEEDHENTARAALAHGGEG